LKVVRAANEIRTLHAHSYVDPDIRGLVNGRIDWETVLQWQVIRQGKGGRTSALADVVAMEGELVAVRDGFQAVFTVWGVVATWKSGGDVPEAVRDALALPLHSTQE
jgi:hypothetical protein